MSSDDTNGADTLALNALVWVLAEPDRADRFLALTGLEGDDIRGRITDPALLDGVLAWPRMTVLVALVVLASLFVYSHWRTPGWLVQPPAGALIVSITAHMWWWEVRYRDPATHGWRMEPGRHAILVGGSSAGPFLSADIAL